jgi:hypothetical protein
VPLCAACTVKVRAGVGWDYYLPTREDVPLPLPEGFSELFKAAKVLLEEHAPENQVIPTLALANHLCHSVPRLVAEKDRLVSLSEDRQAFHEEADRFARRYGGLRPVKVAGGTLILERQPALVTIDYGVVHDDPVGVTISVYPHRTPVTTSEDIASIYGKVLTDAGIACDERRTGRLSFNFHNRRLEIAIVPGTDIERLGEPQPGWRFDEASFPHPRLVGALCEALAVTASAGGFAADLPTRKSGHPPKTENLVPACVAFLLKGYGIQPDKEINGWLDDYVVDDAWKSDMQDRDLFRVALKGTSIHEQVWGNSRKNSIVRDPLIDAAWTLFWEGYDEQYGSTQTLLS